MPQASLPSRLAWIDNLRTLMIVLVVNMHACVTYSHVGSWYRMEDLEPAMPVKIAFMFWQGHLQSFFMGFLFFLAGVFAHQSLERRGPGSFLHERFRRLGLPSLLYMLLIHPFMVYVLLGHPHVADGPSLAVLYGRYLASGRVFSGSGPMWFALALLVFCAVLAVVRILKPANVTPVNLQTGAPSGAALVGFGAVLAVSTFLIRLLHPIGTNVFNFQLCFFSAICRRIRLGRRRRKTRMARGAGKIAPGAGRGLARVHRRAGRAGHHCRAGWPTTGNRTAALCRRLERLGYCLRRLGTVCRNWDRTRVDGLVSPARQFHGPRGDMAFRARVRGLPASCPSARSVDAFVAAGGHPSVSRRIAADADGPCGEFCRSRSGKALARFEENTLVGFGNLRFLCAHQTGPDTVIRNEKIPKHHRHRYRQSAPE